MNKKRKDLINACLKYQEGKNALTKKFTNIQLIPKNKQLTFKQIDDNLEAIARNFGLSEILTSANCLHCNIWNNADCKGCPYDTVVNNCKWAGAKSLYYKVDDRVEALGFGESSKFTHELHALSGTLEKAFRLDSLA